MRDYADVLKQARTCANRKYCDLGGNCEYYDLDVCCQGSEKDILQDAADAIEELLAAVPKWISVEKRLPEKKVGDEGYIGYLVLSDGEYQIADFTHDKYVQTAYEFHVDGEYDPNVTHWMELPPKEVE